MSAARTDEAAIAAHISRALVAAGPSHWLPSPESVTISLLADGIYHANFLVEASGQQCVARVNRKSQWGLTNSAQLTREYAVLHDLKDAGVAPAPLALFADTQTPFLLETYLPGHYLCYGSDLLTCATTIAKVHACPPVCSHPLLDDAPAHKFLIADGYARLDRCTRTTTNQATLNALANFAEDLDRTIVPESPRVLLHTDLIQKNILVADGHCAFVDWEGARLGPRAWDLAYFLSPVTLRWAQPSTLLSESQRAAVIDAYALAAGIEASALADEVGVLLPFVIFRALAWCVAYAETALAMSPRVRELLRLFTSVDFVTETLLEISR